MNQTFSFNSLSYIVCIYLQRISTRFKKKDCCSKKVSTIENYQSVKKYFLYYTYDFIVCHVLLPIMWEEYIIQYIFEASSIAVYFQVV